MKILKRYIKGITFCLLLLLFTLSVFQYQTIVRLEREAGNQVVMDLSGDKMMLNYLELRIINDVSAINDELFTYVNHMIFRGAINRDIQGMYAHIYQPLLWKLTEVEDEAERDEIREALLLFHQDMLELINIAHEKCEIVLERYEDGQVKAVSGDYRRYARLVNDGSRMNKEFRKLVEEKRLENFERYVAINQKYQ